MSGTRKILGRLRREDGFTLIELSIASMIGIVVLTVVLATFDGSIKSAAKVEDRVDAVRHGRLAMESITQALRSQVCVGTPPATIASGTDDSVQFYADTGDETSIADRYRVTYDNTTGTITEDRFDGSGTLPNLTFAAQPSRTRVLADNVERVPGVPVFRYYAFDNANPANPTLLLPTALSQANRERTVRVVVSFVRRAGRASQNDAQGKVTFQNEVYVRTADAAVPGAGPGCTS